MTFTERKIENGFEYFVEDLFGEMTFTSKEKLSPATLDSCVLQLLKTEIDKGIIKDEKNNNDISFYYNKMPKWLDDNENNQ